MCTWIEFRCANRTNKSSHRVMPISHSKCYSHTNDGPAGMCNDGVESVAKLLRELGNEARSDGWKRTKYGWVCPYCAGRPDHMKELAEESEQATVYRGGGRR